MTTSKNAKVVLPLIDWYNFKEIARIRNIDYNISNINTTKCEVEIEAEEKELKKLGY